MKKVIIALMLFTAGIAFAQRGEKDGRDRMKDLSPEQIATLQMKKATLALDLTKGQQSQMKTFLMEKAKMRKTKMAERKAQKENGETKSLTAEERYTRSNERLDQKIAEKARLKEILSEEQLIKWNKIRQSNGKQRKGKSDKSRGHKK